MSITASTREAMRELIPAVTHVDGSARLQVVLPLPPATCSCPLSSLLIPPPTLRSTQTVDKDDAPLYHALIFAFFLAAGVPLVLNTSYNSAVRPTPGSSNPRSFTSSAPLALS